MSDFEFWWLLAFPVFFGLGWIAARIDIRQLLSETRRLPQSYLEGLNFLVNEQPDKAIETFVDIANISTDTVELQFALGKLFRRNGEIDRAIRIHHGLLERAAGDASLELAALRELGLDYRSAGLLDRAEEVFLRLKDTPHEAQAQEWLLDIYVQEKEWKKAVLAAGALAALTRVPRQREIAHYHCELAEAAVKEGRLAQARGHLSAAAGADPAGGRAMLIEARIAMKEGQLAQAADHLLRLEAKSPANAALAAPLLAECRAQQGRLGEAVRELTEWLARHPSADLLDCLFDAALKTEGPRAAADRVRAHLEAHPSLHALDRLLAAQLLLAPDERRRDATLMRGTVAAQVARLLQYRCAACGFSGREHHWRCPGCGGWETIAPQRRETLPAPPRKKTGAAG